MALYWFAFDIGRYESKTAHLSMIQDGAYGRLLRHYYKTGTPIPTDTSQIVRISGAHSEEEIAAVSFVLREFFSERADGWHNRTADEELLKARQVSRKRQELGRKGGLAKARNLLQQNGSNEPGKSLDNNNNNYIKPKPKSVGHFVPPTLQEVTDYCRSRGNAVNPTRWLSHYESNGWMVGRSRMRDWQASVRYWESAGEPNGQDRRNHQAPRAVERFYSNEAMFESELGVASQAKANVSRHEASNSPRTVNALGAGAK